MKQKNSTKHNTQNWRQRLKAYSTMAVAFTALTPTVLGEANPNLHPDTDAHLALPETVGTMAVKCNDVTDIVMNISCSYSGNPTITQSIDLDGDGNNDFKFILSERCSSGTYYFAKAKIEGLGDNEVLREIGGGASIAYVANSDSLQGCGNYTAGGYLAAYRVTANGATNTRGNFGGTTNGYVAVRFDIGGNMHLGWIALSISARVRTLTITEWAYEDTPNAPIKAGSCTDVVVTCTADSGTFAEPPAKK